MTCPVWRDGARDREGEREAERGYTWVILDKGLSPH